MQIHELNNYSGSFVDAYLVADNGSDTGKMKTTALTDPLNARIDNLIISVGPAPSAAEIIDARYGANGATYPLLGDAIRAQILGVMENMREGLTGVESRLSESITELSLNKIEKPTNSDNNKFPRAKNGNVEWVEQGLPTDEQTSTAIRNWLDEHPEATTTVQDHSLTVKKIKIGELKYVTPEMFGAVGDGVEDDTEAIKSALTNHIVLLNGSYLVSDKIELLSDTLVIGNGKLVLTGGVSAQTASGYIYANGKENINFDGVTIVNNCDSNSNDKTICFKDCKDVNISNCTILNEGYRTGWTLVFWNVTKGVIYNNKIKGSDTYQLDDGIHVTGENIEIVGNIVETIDDGIAVGYNSAVSVGGIQPTTSNESQNILISNNIVKCTEGGIHLYTYNAETTIKDVIISNNVVDSRVIIMDDVQNSNNITISNIKINDCILQDYSHSGSNSPITIGNCENVMINCCRIKNTKGVGVITGERNFSDVYVEGCTLVNENPNSPQYKAVINMGVNNSITAKISITGCRIVTNGRVASGYFGSLTVDKCLIENKGTWNDFALQGLGDDGIKIIGNTIKTNANNIIAVGSLTSALFVFAFNVTNCANPTYKIGASNFREEYNLTGVV